MGWESFDYVGLSVSEQIWTNQPICPPGIYCDNPKREKSRLI